MLVTREVRSVTNPAYSYEQGLILLPERLEAFALAATSTSASGIVKQETNFEMELDPACDIPQRSGK